MSSVKVGNAEIVSLLDAPFAFPYSAAYPGVPADKWEPYKAIYPKSWDSSGNWQTNAQAFLIRSAGQTILVDTGVGPGGMGGGPGKLLEQMKSAGIEPGSIDLVILTHLHGDHTGWAVHEGKPLASKARYYAPEADWNLLGSGGVFPPKEALAPLMEAGKLELVSSEKSLTPEVTILPTPGHTAGHQSVILASAGQRAIILGDLFNHPAQVHETTWNAGFDANPEQAVATRSRIFDRLEQDGSVVAAGHYPHPGFGRLVREGGRRIFKEL
ncbi:MAG TPA: MBL fold metallo-hydrolase [Dehalococcoidia bacterium]|nr:MBL fold metallo-hydrolase [Dehalococcoidia bacterium]